MIGHSRWRLYNGSDQHVGIGNIDQQIGFSKLIPEALSQPVQGWIKILKLDRTAGTDVDDDLQIGWGNGSHTGLSQK